MIAQRKPYPQAKPSSAVNVGPGTNWATALLDLLGAPQTQGNYQFLNAWATREHGPSYPSSLYANNPFFTTAGAGGTVGPFSAGMFPSIAGTPGVASYPDVTTGVVATADTLEGGYKGIIAALQSGNPEKYAGNPEFQRELSTWSGGGYSSLATAGQPAVPEGPGIPVPIEGKSASGGFSLPSGSTTLKALEQAGSGNPLGAAATLGGKAAQAIPGVSQAESVASFLGKLSDPSNWVRFGEIVAGGALILVGVIMLAKAGASSGPAKQTAQAAAAPVQGSRTIIREVRVRRNERRYAEGQRNLRSVEGGKSKRTVQGPNQRRLRRQSSEEIPF